MGGKHQDKNERQQSEISLSKWRVSISLQGEHAERLSEEQVSRSCRDCGSELGAGYFPLVLSFWAEIPNIAYWNAEINNQLQKLCKYQWWSLLRDLCLAPRCARDTMGIPYFIHLNLFIYLEVNHTCTRVSLQ